MSVNIYELIACAEQGHIRTGVGASTNPDETLWADYCSRCFADLRVHSPTPPPPSTEGNDGKDLSNNRGDRAQ